MRVELLEPGDHLLLMLIQPGVVDRDGDLVGEHGQQTLVLWPVTLLLFPTPIIPITSSLTRSGTPRKPRTWGWPGWFARTRRVILDIVGDVRAALDNHDPETVGLSGMRLNRSELGSGGDKPLHRDEVHVDPTLVHETNEPRLRFRERQAISNAKS